MHGASVFYAAGYKGGNAQQLNWRYSSVARGHSACAVVSCELLTKDLRPIINDKIKMLNTNLLI